MLTSLSLRRSMPLLLGIFGLLFTVMLTAWHLPTRIEENLAGWRNHDGSTGSPWHAAVRAVCDSLPELAGDEADAVRRLIEQGPPAEEVGLGGYGADPATSSLAGPALISGSTIPVGAPR